MTSKTDIKETRKEQILAAAAIVFSQQGFHKARMDDIVAESGLSKGTLYWYFKSKDDIILALMEQLFSVDLERLHALETGDEPALERIMSYVQYTVEEITEYADLLSIAYEFYANASRREPVQAFLKKYFVEYEQTFTTILQQGIDRGEVRNIDTAKTSFALVALLEGNMLISQVRPEIDVRDHIVYSVKLMIDGLKP